MTGRGGTGGFVHRAPASRARRLVATALVLVLAYAFALNLAWEMWSETGSFGAAMNGSMWLFGVPGRLGLYMLLPWLHVGVAVVLCLALHRVVTGNGGRQPAGAGGGVSFFAAWGLLVIAVACSFAAIKYVGESAVESAGAGRPAPVLSLRDVTGAQVPDLPARLLAEPVEAAIVEDRPLRRRSTSRLTTYVPLAAAAGPGSEVRAVLTLARPAGQALRRDDWAPPYAVRRLFAPVPTWVRGELERSGLRMAPGAVLVERVALDGQGQALPPALSARAEAIVIAAVGSFCGLLLIGLEVLMRRRA